MQADSALISAVVPLICTAVGRLSVVPLLCAVKNPTMTELGVSSHMYIVVVLQLYVHLRSMQKTIVIYL